jgi:hypothetical protein
MAVARFTHVDSTGDKYYFRAVSFPGFRFRAEDYRVMTILPICALLSRYL